MIVKNNRLFTLLLSGLMLFSVFVVAAETLFIAHSSRPDINYTECTKKSLDEVIKKGVRVVECDLAKTTDGVIVLLHPGRPENRDVTTQSAPGERYVHMTLQELHQAKPELMTLEEFLRETPNNIIIALDFKENRGLEEDSARLVAQSIAAGRHTNSQFYALSWNDTVLLKFRQLLPFVKIFPVFLGTAEKNIEYYKAMTADGVVLINRVVGAPAAITPDLVAKLKAAGLKLMVLQPQEGPKDVIAKLMLEFDSILADNVVEYLA